MQIRIVDDLNDLCFSEESIFYKMQPCMNNKMQNPFYAARCPEFNKIYQKYYFCQFFGSDSNFRQALTFSY